MLSTFKKAYSKQNKTKIIFQTNKQKTKTKKEKGDGDASGPIVALRKFFVSGLSTKNFLRATVLQLALDPPLSTTYFLQMENIILAKRNHLTNSCDTE